MKRHLTIAAAGLLLLTACSGPKETPAQALRARLDSYVDAGLVAYGHQDDLNYGHSWKVEEWSTDSLERSDVKSVTGKFPMLVGFDLGGIEVGEPLNLDGVPFDLIRKATLKHIERGGIVTYSWHPRNPFTAGDAWDVSSDKVVESILPGGKCAIRFGNWLKSLADFLESLGPDAAVIFRPWHENVGSWFWWGGKLCSAEQYKQLFRITHDYISVERGLHNVLWCYSPNGNSTIDEYMERYPGDEYVDIMGIDSYESQRHGTLEEAKSRFESEVRTALGALAPVAREHGKVLCLSETGFEGIPDPCWWTQTLHPLLSEFPVAYVLTWRNAHDRPGHFYAAWPGFEHEGDMKAFAEKENILLL